MKRLAAAVLAVIIFSFVPGGSFVMADDTAYTATQSTQPADAQTAQLSQPTPSASTQTASSVGTQTVSVVGTQPPSSGGSQTVSVVATQSPSPTATQPAPSAGIQQPSPIAVQTAKPFNIKYSRNGIYEVVQIAAQGYTDYNCIELKDPLRIVIDLKNTKAPAKQAYIKAGGALVKRVRYARYSEDTSRVVLEMNEGYEYSAESGDNGITVYVSKRLAQETLDKAKAISLGKNYGIKLNTIDSKDAVSVSLKNHDGYHITRYTAPDRLVLTIPDAGVFGSNRLVNVNTRQVGSISYRKAEKAGAVITIELNGQFQYEVDESGDKLVLTFHWPNYTNIYYNSNNDRVYLTLSDTRLTEGAKYLKPLYTEEYDETANRYTITFPTALSAIRDGKLDINDAYLKNFEVSLNPEAGTTSLIFSGNGRNAYLAFTRESGLTTVTVMKPAENSRKIVVIDAGHGGNATGTIYGSTEEKDLNLDMAKRLDTLLAKKGIRTYMLRSEDCGVDNYERVYIANKLNASLYLSIHVNAMDDRSYNGTMTLYCPSETHGFTGLSFAGIIQKNLLSVLRTRNREVISRPDLIVLRETAMPSALAEIAFLSNRTDRANLLKPSFRQKAAQALCDSVVQTLPKL